ncbi:MAG: hypothetical protein EPO32_04675 [Anaerolineae bacterium]|nr:MAG: hypothetical protein EPO32_04675 [Anaerolineae bacterium]
MMNRMLCAVLGRGIELYHIGAAPLNLYGAVFMDGHIMSGVERATLTPHFVPLLPLWSTQDGAPLFGRTMRGQPRPGAEHNW